MDIRQLRTVLAIAETGSLTRAAELLHVVQPALSRQLRSLEDELGVAIFERNSRGMALTEPGRGFLEQVRISLQGLDQAKAAMAASISSLTGTVSIGLLPSLGAAIAAPLVTKLRRLYPDLKVRLASGFTQELQESLERGDLDVALLGDYQPSKLLITEPVLREPLYVVSLPTSGLRRDEALTLTSVAKLPLVLPAPSQGLRQLIERACTIINVSLSPVVESNDTSVQIELVEQGVGFAILPAVAIAPALRAGRLAAAPITAPQLYRRVVISSSVVNRNALTTRTLHKQLITQLQPVFLPLEQMGLTWLAETDDHTAESHWPL